MSPGLAILDCAAWVHLRAALVDPGASHPRCINIWPAVVAVLLLACADGTSHTYGMPVVLYGQ